VTDAFANAAQLKAKNILIDPSGTGAPYSFTLFPRTAAEVAARDNARISFVTKSNSIEAVTFVPDAGHTIMDPDTKGAVTTLDVVMNGESIEFIFWASRSQWIVFREPGLRIAELWEGTPIIDIAGKTIQWTHLGPFPTTVILDVAGGVFTFKPTVTRFVELQLNVETNAIIAANNAEVDWIIDDTFSGAGLELMPRLVGSKQSTRTANFPSSQQSNGVIQMAEGDFLQFDCTSTGTSGSTVDLTSSFLTVSGEI